MRDKVLIVSGMESERESLGEVLQSDYKIMEASDGEEAIAKIEKSSAELAVVFMKLTIPKKDGLTILKEMNEKKLSGQIPVVMMERPDSLDVENQCFDLGISTFISKPFSKKYIQKELENVVSGGMSQKELEAKLDKQNQMMRRQYQMLQIQTNELKQSRKNLVDILGSVVEYRDAENSHHVKNVEIIVRILADEMMKSFPECGLNAERVDTIVSASVLHDIGKIRIQDAILFKPGKLTPEELEVMKSHTTKGCEVIEQIKGVWDEDYSEAVYEICRSHHERYDGRGYPDGLRGDDIPLHAQIVSVADAYDALVSDTLYRKAFSKDQAFAMIINGESGMFNPKLMECLRKAKDRVERSVIADADMDV